MLELAKLVGILALIVFLLRLKWNLGVVLILASGFTALLFGRAPADLGRDALAAVLDPLTLQLALIVLLIALLGEILRTMLQLDGLVSSLTRLVSDQRWLLALLPMMIGLLPMIGGAMFSAPMVAAASRDLDVGRERQTFINYWFRHALEPVFPLYPSLVLAAGLLGVSPQRLTLSQWPLFVAVIAGGVLFGLLGLARRPAAVAGLARRPAAVAGLARRPAAFAGLRSGPVACQEPVAPEPGGRQTWLLLAQSVWPLVLVLGLALGLGVDLVLALLLTIVVLIAVHRLSPRQVWDLVRRVPLGPIPLIAGAMIFRQVLEASGAVERVAAELAGLHVPLPVVVFGAPFLSGLLTGLLTAAFAIGFPIGLPLTGGDPVDTGFALLAYTGGLIGLMLSPMHLCLSLTREYFQAEWGGIYRRLLPAAGLLLAAVGAVLLIKQ